MSTSSSDIERATQNLRARQQEYYVQWVKDAIESELQRKTKLEKATSKDECRRLERQYEKERIKDRERMQQIREDHNLILNAKIAEWSAHGVPESALASSTSTASIETCVNGGGAAPTSINKKPKSTSKMSKATLERLSTPAASTTLITDDTQGTQFHKDVIRRENRVRLQRYQTKPSATGENLKTLTETDLLQRKLSLLTQLHGVVSLQERIFQDDQCTVRSSVSSWKSAEIQSSERSWRQELPR